MIEYLYDAIRALAGSEIKVHTWATDENENIITEGCSLVLHDKEKKMMASIPGTFDEEVSMWDFVIPAEMTEGLKGRYWYCIQHEDNALCFMQPIYLV